MKRTPNRYEMDTLLDSHNRTVFIVRNRKPGAFESGICGHFATAHDAQYRIDELYRQDVRNAAIDRATKLTKGARAQLAYDDWLAHFQSVRDDFIREHGFTV